MFFISRTFESDYLLLPRLCFVGLLSSVLVITSEFVGPCFSHAENCFAVKRSIRAERRCRHFCRPQISPPGSVCELIFTLVAHVVRSWMKRLGVHHRHRGRDTTKGTPVPLRSYCLNVDNNAVLEVRAITIGTYSTQKQPATFDEQRSLA